MPPGDAFVFNKKMSIIPPATKTLFFGDSNTAGEGLLDPCNDRWTARVARAQGVTELNEGKGGRASSAFQEFRATLEACKKDTGITRLVIALGGNDARDAAPDVAEKVEDNLELMINLARSEAPAWEVILCGPCNINAAHVKRKEIADQRERNLLSIRSSLRTLASAKGCLFVDFFDIIPSASLTEDGVHPDAAGHKALAAAFLAAVPSTRSLATDTNSNLRSHHLRVDFAVVGGGMAGVCATLAAARNGVTVVLLQDRSVLGGNASSEIKMHIGGADCHGGRPGTRESGLIEELRLDDAVGNSHRCYSQWDLLLYEKIKAEPKITLLLDTTCMGCELNSETGAIQTIHALRNSTEEIFHITADLFADCSGDSRLGLESGADMRVGRESRDEFGESLAPEKSDHQTLGSSILITGRKHDMPVPFRGPNWIRKFTKDDLAHRPIHSFEYGYWWFEWGGQLDTIHDNEIIRHELLRIALGIWDYVKNSGNHPDSANWALNWVGAIPGKRESRRLLGPHLLTQGDVTGGRLFPDAVAYGGWAIDLHPPSGVDARDEPPYTPTHSDHVYTIPLRALFSRNVPNLLFAGRNISATHVAFASTRVMATCAIMGQAIGTAAALAIERKVPLQSLAEGGGIHDLQQRLLKDDAFIPDVRNEDPLDLARGATVTVSSEQPGKSGALILDGLSRDLIGRFGKWADQRFHHWESKGLPAWIELRFPAEIEIREIHLTFDTGFVRELILTASDHMSAKVIRGPQPETVRAYRIIAGDTIVVEETDNYQRKKVHSLPKPIAAMTLKIEILATHGVPDAHLFEVRVY